MIVCDKCLTNNVLKNGQICDECLKEENESKIDRSYMNNIYLPQELFEKFEKLHDQIDPSKKETLSAFGKFMNTLKTSFINHKTGKEINDPTPKVIVPTENTLDRIKKLLDHNLSVYAKNNDMDTLDDLENWSVKDMYADDWEETLYQYVDNIEIMEDETPPESKKDDDTLEDKQMELPLKLE